jgi:hypothetical protein
MTRQYTTFIAAIVTAAACFGYVEQPPGCNCQECEIIVWIYNFNAVRESRLSQLNICVLSTLMTTLSAAEQQS